MGRSDRHYFQYFASLVDDSSLKYLPLGIQLILSKVNTILIMIGLVCLANPINELASKYQALALKIIVKPAHANSLRKLVSGGLIDLSKPILNKGNQSIYHSFLTITFVEKNIEPEKSLTLS